MLQFHRWLQRGSHNLPQAQACSQARASHGGAVRREVGELRPGEVEQLSQVPAPPAAVGPATHRTCHGPLAGCTCLLGPHWTFLESIKEGRRALPFLPILLSHSAHGPGFHQPVEV